LIDEDLSLALKLSRTLGVLQIATTAGPDEGRRGRARARVNCSAARAGRNTASPM